MRSLSWRVLVEALLPAALLLISLPFLYRLIGLSALSLLLAGQVWLAVWLGWRLRLGSGPRRWQALRLAGWSLLAAALFQALYFGLTARLLHGERAAQLLCFDCPPERIALRILGLAAGIAIAWLLLAAGRRLAARLNRRFERRLQTALTARFVLVALLAIVLAELAPGGLLVAGLYLYLPAETEAGLYARRVADALTNQPTETRRAAADPLFDGLMAGALPRPAPLALEDRLLYTFRLPASLTGRLAGVGFYSPQGRLLTSRGALGPEPDLTRLPASEAIWQSIGLTAARGERDAIATSRRVLSVTGSVYHVGAAAVTDGAGRVIGVTIVWMEAATIFGAAADFYTPFITFAMLSLILTGLGAVVLLPAGLAAALLGRRTAAHIAAPARALSAAAAAMAAGNLGQRADVARPDELGDLARQFNQMADRLQAALVALQNEKDTVARLAHARQEMVANVSHDLRTPLAALTAYLETLTDHPDRLADYLPILNDETGRLARLVNDLFALARLDANELELRLGPVDLESLLAKSAADFAPLAWNNRRVIVKSVLPDNLPPALADPQRVEQILSNLLTNALRHTPEGGVITVAATLVGAPVGVSLAGALSAGALPLGAHVEVRVTDTGAGISPDDLPHVFERFYRTDPARSGTGAGLGLAIVKALVEAQGGRAGVENAPGQGASFWFTLPVAQH